MIIKVVKIYKLTPISFVHPRLDAKLYIQDFKLVACYLNFTQMCFSLTGRVLKKIRQYLKTERFYIII